MAMDEVDFDWSDYSPPMNFGYFDRSSCSWASPRARGTISKNHKLMGSECSQLPDFVN